MNQQLQTLRTTLTRKQGQELKIEKDLIRTNMDIVRLKDEVDYTEKARLIIQKVAKATQAELEYYISELVTLAFASVFPDPYEFGVAFEEKRGKTECRMRFLRNGHEVNPLSGSGGGPLDIASTTLQFTIWSLNKTRAIIGLDEPFKFLDVSLHKKAGEMLKAISEKLGLQIFLITHIEKLAKQADKMFEFYIAKQITRDFKDFQKNILKTSEIKESFIKLRNQYMESEGVSQTIAKLMAAKTIHEKLIDEGILNDNNNGSEEPKPTRRRKKTQKPLGILP